MSTKDREILNLKRMIHGAQEIIDQLGDEILHLTVRKHQIEDKQEQLEQRLEETEKEQSDEMQSVQTEHGNERQLHGGGEQALPPKVLCSNKDKS